MTSLQLYMPTMTTSYTTTSISPSLTLSSALTATISAMAGHELETHIRVFWSRFPCPPPWRPNLLLEVNATRFKPRVGRTVQAFLAGKCDIVNVLQGEADFDGSHYFDSGKNLGSDRGDVDDSKISLSNPKRSEEPWCDTTCRLAVGCASVFVIMAGIVAVLLCLNRRHPHKMPSNRPSRQQLHLSTSANDNANFAEFSNMEVTGDDDSVYPPFRHRCLPQPPGACHPSCSSYRNCSSCIAGHPLMNQSSCYRTRTYSAVYETIDDNTEDELIVEDRCGNNETLVQHIPTILDNVDIRHPWHKYSMNQLQPGSISTIQIRPHTRDDIKFTSPVAETDLTSDNDQERCRPYALPNYFELDKECALARSNEELIPGPLSAFTSVSNSLSTHRVTSHDVKAENLSGATSGQHDVLPKCAQESTNESAPFYSFPVNQVTMTCQPNAGERYRTRHSEETSRNVSSVDSLSSSHHNQPEHIPASRQKLCSVSNSNIIPTQSTCCHYYQVPYSNVSQEPPNSIVGHPTERTGQNTFRTITDSPASGTSMFFSPLAPNLSCPECQLNCIVDNSGYDHHNCRGLINAENTILAPDILNEASKHRARVTQLNGDAKVSDEEVPLKKPVLALHSQYFTNSTNVR